MSFSETFIKSKKLFDTQDFSDIKYTNQHKLLKTIAICNFESIYAKENTF